MSEINSAIAIELEEIRPFLKGNERLIELFQTLPTPTIEVYNLTSEIYANRCYDEINAQDKIIPHGFYNILEHNIRLNGLIPTLKKYEREVSLIAETMKMKVSDLKLIIKDLREPKVENILEHNRRLESQAKLKEIIRKFTSKYKENYLKKIIAERQEALKPYITYNHKVKPMLPIKDFISSVKTSALSKELIRSYIHKKLGIKISDKTIEDLIKASFDPNYIDLIINILNIKYEAPEALDYFQSNRNGNRLKNNYERKLNNQTETRTPEEKEALLKIITYRTIAKRTQTNEESPEFNQLKMIVKAGDLYLSDEISSVMSKCDNCTVTLEDGKFVFHIPRVLTKEERSACQKYIKFLKDIKGIHNIIHEEYNHQNKTFQLLADNDTEYTTIPEQNYTIDITPWYKSDKIIRLLSKINLRKILELSNNEFNILKDLLLNKGLLWAYLCDNIELKNLAIIINNFEYIVKSCEIDKLTSENLNEITKKAYLYGYADEVLIGLIGIDNVAKIINYNQFTGVAVTDEVIKKRLNKVTDLAVRSERYPFSSLPFDCSVKLGGYTLSRYLNNDPSVFTSGIDTKTCFFVSVNENDFFFYSLIHKDGYIIKITNAQGELVARASCFRKNNVLMINGIRCKNNKVVPDNQEELQEMIKLVDLIKLMAQKMINMTKDDECPIDFVVCNRAGILENAVFENQFEKLNPILFNEPINVYSDEWQKFVHLYDNEEEQMLQEVPHNPSHSFTTDFGDHYPALLIASRDYRGLLSPRDISIADQSETYRRPRAIPQVYMRDEITDDILAKINRIRALACFVGDKKKVEEKRHNFRLINNIDNIDSIVLGDDWVIIYYLDKSFTPSYANPSKTSTMEAAKYINEHKAKESGVKLYYIPRNKDIKS